MAVEVSSHSSSASGSAGEGPVWPEVTELLCDPEESQETRRAAELVLVRARLERARIVGDLPARAVEVRRQDGREHRRLEDPQRVLRAAAEGPDPQELLGELGVESLVHREHLSKAARGGEPGEGHRAVVLLRAEGEPVELVDEASPD